MSTTTTVAERPMRAQLAPHAAVGVLVIAASASRLAVDLSGNEASVAAWTASTAFVIAVVLATTARRRVFDKRTLRRVYAFLGVAVTWLAAVTVTGLDVGAVGVLMAVGYGLSLHWFRTHPVGLIAEQVEPARYVELWEDNIGAADGCLPGSLLVGEQTIRAGVRYAVRLRPGKQTYEMALGALGKIRGGLELRPDQDIILEPHPKLPEPSLLLTIVTRSPIKESVDWPGPQAFDPRTGRVRLGPFADGEGVATWKAYTDNRLWGGYLQGGTGSGKSRMIESLALSLAASDTHPTVIFYGDGQGGASSPLLMKHADHKARSHGQILAMLEGVHLVMLLRQDENAVEGLEGFTPTADRPGLLAVVDECHKPLSKIENPLSWDRIQYLMATIAREGGKVGVGLILASQMSTLDAFGGAGSPNAEAIRSNILAGNGVILRGKDPNAKQIFGVDVNPKKFPPLAGYGFLVDPEPGGRSAPFRGYYVNDQQRAVWPDRIHWRSLDVGAANAYGDGYLRRQDLADEALEQVRLRVAARRAGQPVADAPNLNRTPAAPSTEQVLEVYGAQSFPSWSEMAAQVRQEAERQLRDGHEKALTALRAGHGSPARIAEATGYSVRQVHNLLDDLIAAGRVRKGDKQGAYELADRAA